LTGEFLLQAVDLSAEMLFHVKERASAISEHHSAAFRKSVDGAVQTF
jgi:hypothetical protein